MFCCFPGKNRQNVPQIPAKENLVNSVFCCFSWEKSTKCSPNPGLVNQFSATPRGQLNWTGPIANSSDRREAAGKSSPSNLRKTTTHPPPCRCMEMESFVLLALGPKIQEWPRQTKPKKGQFMNFSQGHSGIKVRYVSFVLVFLRKNKPEFTQKWAKFMNFSFWPFLCVWFAGATPEKLNINFFITQISPKIKQKRPREVILMLVFMGSFGGVF